MREAIARRLSLSEARVQVKYPGTPYREVAYAFSGVYTYIKNSFRIQEENIKESHNRVVSF